MTAADTVRASLAVEDRMFRALAVLRVVVTGYALVTTAVGYQYDHPLLGWLLLAGMAAWTGVAIAIYREPSRRTPLLLVVDLGLAVGLLLATPLVKGPWFEATIPGFWIIGALLAWAVRYGWRGGLLAAVLLGGSDLLIRSDLQQHDVGQVFLLVLAGPTVGFVCESLQRMAADRDRAQREAAAAAERVRLGRAVHDGVLQVLALTQRRAAELGGEAAELGRLAGQQEAALRALIRSQDAVQPTAASGTEDLAAALAGLATRPGVEVAVPGGVHDVPRAVADEVVAAVGACLDNVTRHVGDGAPAWVLLEELDDRYVVSVRDEGPGIPEGRLQEAAGEGRLGVSQSIRGRIEDLGGTVRLDTGSFGTEWEFDLPKETTA